MEYHSIGRPAILAKRDEDEVAIIGNADGLRSLAQALLDLVDTGRDADHIHLLPTMQLLEESEQLTLALREDLEPLSAYPVPDGQ